MCVIRTRRAGDDASALNWRCLMRYPRQVSLLAALLLVLAGCGSANVGSGSTPPPCTVHDYRSLMCALKAARATVETGHTTPGAPLFSVPGQLLIVNHEATDVHGYPTVVAM